MEYHAVIKNNEKTLYVKNGHASKEINLKKGHRRVCRVCPWLCKILNKEIKREKIHA